MARITIDSALGVLVRSVLLARVLHRFRREERDLLVS
jgi:hypothetical protein